MILNSVTNNLIIIIPLLWITKQQKKYANCVAEKKAKPILNLARVRYDMPNVQKQNQIMKTKSQPLNLNLPDPMVAATLKCLSTKGIQYAKQQIQHFDDIGRGIPCGAIRKVALTL